VSEYLELQAARDRIKGNSAAGHPEHVGEANWALPTSPLQARMPELALFFVVLAPTHDLVAASVAVVVVVRGLADILRRDKMSAPGNGLASAAPPSCRQAFILGAGSIGVFGQLDLRHSLEDLQ
jgi:hypothetical protein